jgi:hypothetical protein
VTVEGVGSTSLFGWENPSDIALEIMRQSSNGRRPDTALSITLPSFGSIECDPNCKVISKIFKSVNLSSRHKKKRAGINAMSPLPVVKLSPSSCDKIDLVARMWLLGIIANGSVHFNGERAV